MADSNTSRAEGKARFQRNKVAFEEVFGNPFIKPEPLQGHYLRFKTRSPVGALEYSDDTHATKNPCSPSISDFFCDVEKIVLDVMQSQTSYERFMKTYIYDEDDTIFSAKTRQQIEQEVGAALLAKRISPVLNYFQTERKPGTMTRK